MMIQFKIKNTNNNCATILSQDLLESVIMNKLHPQNHYDIKEIEAIRSASTLATVGEFS